MQAAWSFDCRFWPQTVRQLCFKALLFPREQSVCGAMARLSGRFISQNVSWQRMSYLCSYLYVPSTIQMNFVCTFEFVLIPLRI